MPLKFYGWSVPVSMVLGTIYFYYVTQYKPAQKKKAMFKDLDVVTHYKPSSCRLLAGKGDLVHVHYTSYLKSDGKQFETTRNNAEPYVFKLGACNDQTKPECIKGFEMGLMDMCAGEKRKVTVPPKFGYPPKARPKEISKSETIIYNVELVDIDKA
eukprot:TRINITY_DN768_c0_g1_i2.p1 TRINITY_DN768_c0_g1~~TRINITY_DN768_c0_g1_i2.p1  ORF type:complete len:156 (-),score=25.75 TRINITY_DN768_c0_g1_i2:466-933(-)